MAHVLDFMFGVLFGATLIIWLNGRLLMELSGLVKVQNDLLVSQNKMLCTLVGVVLKETADDPR